MENTSEDYIKENVQLSPANIQKDIKITFAENGDLVISAPKFVQTAIIGILRKSLKDLDTSKHIIKESQK